MKKKTKLVALILIVLAILLIVLGIVLNNKKTDNSPSDNNKTNDNITPKLGIVVCTRNADDNDNFTYIEEDTINSDKDGNFTNDVSKQIYKYKDENVYQQLKNGQIDLNDGTEISYNDSEKAIIYTKIITDVYNSKNEKVDITIKEYQEALENNDYTCVEK